MRAALGGKGCWIEGNATPFGMYAKLYRHRDEFVVIDDVDALYADRSGVRLLKCLCQTEEEKAVAWHSDARSLERQGIPREFTTKSRVVIISNDWKTLNKNVAALQDRGHVRVVSSPAPPRSTPRRGRGSTTRRFTRGLPPTCTGCVQPSLRHYVRARELKAAGMDWTEILAAEGDDNRRARLAAELLASDAYDSIEARVRRSSSRGEGAGRRSITTNEGSPGAARAGMRRAVDHPSWLGVRRV